MKARYKLFDELLNEAKFELFDDNTFSALSPHKRGKYEVFESMRNTSVSYTG